METKIPTLTELRENYYEHHTCTAMGYISRKSDGVIVPYKGRYGEGYKYLQPNWDSSNYCLCTYFVK